MTIYLVNIFLIGIYSLIYNIRKKDNKIKMIFITISILQLILLQALKDINIGSDMGFYWQYVKEQLYVSFQDLDFSRFEIGFKILTKIITMVTLNQQNNLFIISFIATTSIGVVAYKYSKMPFLTILLYLSFGFYNFNFSGLRQAMAFGVVMFSYKYIQEKKLLKYIITMLLAISFHTSAIVFLPAYFLKNINLTKQRVLLIALIDVIVFIFKKQIFNIISLFIYDNYTIVETNSYTWMLMCLSIVAICLLFYNATVRKNENAKSLYIYVIIGASLMLFAPIANNILRIANYYLMFMILLIPEVMETMKNDKNKYLINFLVVAIAILIYLDLLNGDAFNIVPYKFFWQ